MNEVMRDLGIMVHEQGESVGEQQRQCNCSNLYHLPIYPLGNLESNVERAHAEVVHGNQQLGSAVRYKVSWK